MAFKNYVAGSECKMVLIDYMTFGVSCSVVVVSIVDTAAGVAGDTAVITACLVNGMFSEVVTEGAVAKDGVVMVAESISEVTITEVMVVVTKVIIDGVVTEVEVAEENIARVARDLCRPPWVQALEGGKGKEKIDRDSWSVFRENKFASKEQPSNLGRALKPSSREEEAEWINKVKARRKKKFSYGGLEMKLTKSNKKKNPAQT